MKHWDHDRVWDNDLNWRDAKTYVEMDYEN